MFIITETNCSKCGRAIPPYSTDAQLSYGNIICATCANPTVTEPVITEDSSATIYPLSHNVIFDANTRKWICTIDWREFDGPSMFAISQHYRHRHGGKQNMVVGNAVDNSRELEQRLVNVISNVSPPDAEAIAAVQQHVFDADAGEPTRDLFTSFGNKMYEDIERALHAKPPVPIGVEGPTGHGKSTIIDMIADTAPWNGTYAIQACHRGMDINAFVGGMYPVPDPSVLVEWHDGKLTRMARQGGIYHIEEMANADPDVLSRLHQVMDEGSRRFLDLVESPEGSVSVDANFRYVASYNPPAKNYTSNKIPMPVMRRFGYIFRLNETVVNEPELMKLYMPEETARRCMALVVELRRSADTWVCSRDVKLWGQAIANGFEPLDAVRYSLIPKFTASVDVADSVLNMARSHFAPNTLAPSSMPTESEY